MKPTYEELGRERNELAAQVERLSYVLTRMVNEKAVNGAFYHKVSDELFELAESALSETPPSALSALKAQWNCPTVEHGKNRYGLDVAYFRDLFNRELNRTLHDYRPHELARNLLRMARTADESVIAEAEFSGELKAQWQAEAVQSILEECEQWSLMGTWGVLVDDISEKLEGLYQRAQEPSNANTNNPPA